MRRVAGIPRTVRKRPFSCSQWPQDWRRSVFISTPKKGNAEECSNYHTVALISHASKVMVKILQARLQQYVNQELPECTSWVSKRQRNQRSNCQHSMVHRESKGDPEKHLLPLHRLHQSLWLWVTTDCGRFLKRWGRRRNLRDWHAGQEATVRTLRGTTDWFTTGKGVHKGCILSPYLFNPYAEYIMWRSYIYITVLHMIIM